MRELQWQATWTMLGSWLIGVLLAVVHDQYYSRLDGREASSGDYRIGAFTYSRQQAHLTAGLAFAVLVKICLVMAASTAFTQLFWAAAKGKSHKGGISLAKVDTMHQSASNLLAFLKPSGWLSAPGSALVALTIWLIPVASIFTPATLSVEIQDQLPLNITDFDVPTLDFRSLAFAQKMPLDISSFDYAGPSPEVLQIAQTTATNGAILPIVPPAPNSSWSTTFQGPSLKCSEVLGSELEAVLANVAKWVRSGNNCEGASGYLSWMQRHKGPQIDLPYDNHVASQMHNASDPGYFESGSLSYSLSEGGSDASILMALLPNMVEERQYWENPMIMSCSVPFNTDPVGFLAEEATLVRCDLMNATYTTAFDFVEGTQNLTVQVSNNSPAAVKVVKQIFFQYIVPYCLEDNDAHRFTYNKSGCAFDSVALERLSYQSIMSAFSSLIKGQVTRNTGTGGGLSLNTSVGMTSLAKLDRLRFLADERYTLGTSLQEFLAEYEQVESYGVGKIYSMDANDTNHNGSLPAALEELFQNITISLMSSPSLLANKSSITAPPPAKVTFALRVPTYVYVRQRLWLAYGIAIALCTLATLAGLIIICLRGKTYSSEFSTILRATRHAELSMEVAKEDTDGKSPLPDYLARCLIRFDSCDEVKEAPGGSPTSNDMPPARSSLSEQSAGVASSMIEMSSHMRAAESPRRNSDVDSSVAEEETTFITEPARVSLLGSNSGNSGHSETSETGSQTPRV